MKRPLLKSSPLLGLYIGVYSWGRDDTSHYPGGLPIQGRSYRKLLIGSTFVIFRQKDLVRRRGSLLESLKFICNATLTSTTDVRQLCRRAKHCRGTAPFRIPYGYAPSLMSRELPFLGQEMGPQDEDIVSSRDKAVKYNNTRCTATSVVVLYLLPSIAKFCFISK